MILLIMTHFGIFKLLFYSWVKSLFRYDVMYWWNIIEATSNQDALLQEFGMGGLANICLGNNYFRVWCIILTFIIEKRHHGYIMSEASYRDDIIKCLDKTSSTNLLVNAMATLMQLVTADNYTGK